MSRDDEILYPGSGQVVYQGDIVRAAGKGQEPRVCRVYEVRPGSWSEIVELFTVDGNDFVSVDLMDGGVVLEFVADSLAAYEASRGNRVVSFTLPLADLEAALDEICDACGVAEYPAAVRLVNVIAAAAGLDKLESVEVQS